MNKLTIHQSETALLPISSNSIPWIPGPRHWFYVLVILGSFLAVVTPHPPFLSLTVVAAASLPLRKAGFSMGAFWVIHVISDYTFRSIPFTSAALLWELMLALSLSLVLGITVKFASYVSSRSSTYPATVLDSWLVIASSFGLGFFVFEGLAVLFWVGLGGHGYTPGVVSHLLIQASLWTLGLVGLRVSLELFRGGALHPGCCIP